MNVQRREQIQRSLRSLADSQLAAMRLMEQTLSLLQEEFALDPATYFQRYVGPRDEPPRPNDLQIDQPMLSVRFREKSCFLGNTRPFRFICALATRLNCYVSYDDLLQEVWNGTHVSDEAIRTVAKNLRKSLRSAGMAEVANAIDGSERGHYALKADWH